MSGPTLKIYAALLALCALEAQAKIQSTNLPDSLLKCFETFSKKTFFKDRPAEQLSSTCLQRYMWTEDGARCKNMTQPELDYIGSLMVKFLRRRTKRQANRRRRQEYRSLTQDQRNIYHRAVTTLKGRPAPRNYDTIARYHQANAGGSAHGGPNFPGWHRVYLLIYEEALIDASGGRMQALPYLDWRLDSRLSNPSRSILWTPEFLGTSNGRVVSGPFANWTVAGSSLVRNVGLGASITADRDVRGLFRINNVRAFGDDLESVHNTGHVYVGGLMLEVERATFDPIFFMHHCFIDYLWWRFQCPGGRCRRERFVYPGRSSDGQHAPNRAMDNLEFRNRRLRNREGYAQRWLNDFTYENSPAECTTSCSSLSRSGALECTANTCRAVSTSGNTSGGNTGGGNTGGGNTGGGNTGGGGVDYDFDYYNYYDNIPFSRSASGSQQNTRQKRQAVHTPASLFSKHSTRDLGFFLARPVQNLYRVNCESNTNQWGYIPVKVVHVRSKSVVYNSYPVRNGKVLVSKHRDIYDQRPDIKKINRLTKPGRPKHYMNCTTDGSGAFRVTINSYGINYYGFYEEYAIMDNRAPLYSAMTYIAVRRPTKNKSSKVYLTAFDNCGRSCSPECLVPNSNPPRYRPCTGALNVDDKLPRGYANTYDDAVLMYYNFKEAGSCPVINEQNVPIVFYCKQADAWLPKASKSTYS